MSDAEKRVEVAKNTLARIAIKQLVGYHWCDNRRMDSLKGSWWAKKIQLTLIVNLLVQVCTEVQCL
jgi:hypothetical protein